jgi:peroxiredoxin
LSQRELERKGGEEKRDRVPTAAKYKSRGKEREKDKEQQGWITDKKVVVFAIPQQYT